MPESEAIVTRSTPCCGRWWSVKEPLITHGRVIMRRAEGQMTGHAGSNDAFAGCIVMLIVIMLLRCTTGNDFHIRQRRR